MKGKGILRKIGIWIPLLGVALYTISPKLKFAQHRCQQEIADVFWKNKWIDSIYTHENRETITILNTMSGYIKQDDLKKLLLTYWYTDVESHIDSSIKVDKALYKALWEMNMKYGNPNITFSWDYENRESWNQEDKRARFWVNKIQLHNVKDLKINFQSPLKNIIETNAEVDNQEVIKPWFDSTNQKLWENRQQYLINNWIAELSHAKQYQRDGAIRMWMDWWFDYLRSWFDYEKTYDMNHTTENEAHSKIEPLLCQEFINLYKKYANLQSHENTLFLWLMNLWYFDKYKNIDEWKKYLAISAKLWSPIAKFFLAKIHYIEWKKLQDQVDQLWADIMDPKAINEWKQLEHETIGTFTDCVKSNLTNEYSYKYLSTISERGLRWNEAKEYTHQHINTLESIKNPSKEQIYKLALWYMHLAKLYNKSYIEEMRKFEAGKITKMNNDMDLANEYIIKAWRLARQSWNTLPYWPHFFED